MLTRSSNVLMFDPAIAAVLANDDLIFTQEELNHMKICQPCFG
jgi:hypothetical protein